MVLAPGELTEVPHVEAEMALAVQAQDPLQFVDGHPPQGGELPAAIEQPVIAVVLVAPPQPAHRTGAHAQDLGYRPPRALPTQGSQDNFLHFHGPLHGRRGIRHGRLLGSHDSRTARWERSNHLLSGAARSCAPDKCAWLALSIHEADCISCTQGADAIAKERISRGCEG
jgi:hypothetical protein